MLKLAIIRQSYRPDGGAEKIISRLLDGLRRRADVQVSIITQKWQKNILSDNVSILQVARKGWFRSSRFKYFINGVNRVLHTTHFDLVQSHERVPGCQIYRAGDGVHAEWLRIKISREGILGRLFSFFSLFHRVMLRAESKLFHHPNLEVVICISQRGKRDVLHHYPTIDPSKITCIYNGIDIDNYHPQFNVINDPVRVKLDFSPDTPVAIFVGSGFTRKGLDDLLEALVFAVDWQLLVIGKDKKQNRFIEKSRKLGVNNRVHFLGVQTQVQDFYSAADLLIHPAWYEPFGNVVLEAMAMGRGVLVSSNCGASELVEEGINGYVFDTGDSKQLANLLDKCKDRTLLKSLGSNARRTAEQYPISRMVDELLAVYQTLLTENFDENEK